MSFDIWFIQLTQTTPSSGKEKGNDLILPLLRKKSCFRKLCIIDLVRQGSVIKTGRVTINSMK